MKKLIAALFAAILTTVGLVAVSSAPAQAAPCGYVKCVPVKVKAKASTTRAGQSAQVTVQVKVNGNVKAKGTVRVVITGPKGFKRTITVKVTSNKTLKVATGKLPRAGKYKVKVTFKGAEGFTDSKASATIKVNKAKKNKKK